MKKIINIKKTPVLVDTDEMKFKALPEKTRGIDSVYVIPEDADVHWESTLCDPIDVHASKDDILVTFYNDDLGRDFVIVKSEDWNKMLENADNAIQKRNEEWAIKKCEGHCDCACKL